MALHYFTQIILPHISIYKLLDLINIIYRHFNFRRAQKGLQLEKLESVSKNSKN